LLEWLKTLLAPQKSDDEGQAKVEIMRGVAALGGVGEEIHKKELQYRRRCRYVEKAAKGR
jgi:hypothetical protein